MAGDEHERVAPVAVRAAPVVLVGAAGWAVALVAAAVAGAPAVVLETCGVGLGLGLLGAPLADRMQRPRR